MQKKKFFFFLDEIKVFCESPFICISSLLLLKRPKKTLFFSRKGCFKTSCDFRPAVI